MLNHWSAAPAPRNFNAEAQGHPAPGTAADQNHMPAPILPPALITAVQEQRAILFLGAGASRDAIHPKGEPVPLGDKLRDKISDKFLAANSRTAHSSLSLQWPLPK
jgi:hypothetical protein